MYALQCMGNTELLKTASRYALQGMGSMTCRNADNYPCFSITEKPDMWYLTLFNMLSKAIQYLYISCRQIFYLPSYFCV